VKVIEFESVSKTYPGPPAVEALREADLVVSSGDFLSVIGPSGSGKSTFLNIVGLLDRPTGGRYLLDGIDTVKLSERDRTAMRGRRLGFVFQAFHLIGHRSALENVMLALVYTERSPRRRRQRSQEMLERVGLTTRAEAQAAYLSGGERQRVAIARALVNDPSLLLCDEPTGNLDSTNSAKLMDLLKQLHHDGLTIVVVTHDPGVAASGQRTVVIRDGVLCEEER
jgi:putative ABC transport system ATP-binding protein